MCTVIILRRPEHHWPVLLAANRDELKQRPWRPPGRHWPDRSGIVAGLDEAAGGSWLGVNDHGVLAAVLNRVGTLGPAAGKRSRGELVLRALEAPDAEAATSAITRLEAGAYRSFNLLIADRTAAWWLRQEDDEAKSQAAKIEAFQLGSGLSMITAHNLNDPASPRISYYRPRFRAAQPPDPDRQDWQSWKALMASRDSLATQDPTAAMTIVEERGFETTSSSFVALPGDPGTNRRVGADPIWLFAPGRPDRTAYQPVKF